MQIARFGDANWEGEREKPWQQAVRVKVHPVSGWLAPVVVGLTNSLTITLFEGGVSLSRAAPTIAPRRRYISLGKHQLPLVLLDNLAICKIASPGWSRIWRHRVATHFHSARLCQAARARRRRPRFDPAGEKSIRLKSLPTSANRADDRVLSRFPNEMTLLFEHPCFNNPSLISIQSRGTGKVTSFFPSSSTSYSKCLQIYLRCRFQISIYNLSFSFCSNFAKQIRLATRKILWWNVLNTFRVSMGYSTCYQGSHIQVL